MEATKSADLQKWKTIALLDLLMQIYTNKFLPILAKNDQIRIYSTTVNNQVNKMSDSPSKLLQFGLANIIEFTILVALSRSWFYVFGRLLNQLLY